MHLAKKILGEGGDVALILLRLIHASAEFPPLKWTAGGALQIAELVAVCILNILFRVSMPQFATDFQIEPKGLESFGQRIRNVVARVLGSI